MSFAIHFFYRLDAVTQSCSGSASRKASAADRVAMDSLRGLIHTQFKPYGWYETKI